jgi:large subunit ribosomal protein L16
LSEGRVPKQKFKKSQKRRSFLKVNSVVTLNKLKFGSFALKSIEPGVLTSKQIESMFQSINKIIKKSGRIILRVFSHEPVCKKPIEVRMGKGKGQPEYWVAVVRPGNILFELDGISETVARESLRLAANKLPLRTRFLTRHHAV